MPKVVFCMIISGSDSKLSFKTPTDLKGTSRTSLIELHWLYRTQQGGKV